MRVQIDDQRGAGIAGVHQGGLGVEQVAPEATVFTLHIPTKGTAHGGGVCRRDGRHQADGGAAQDARILSRETEFLVLPGHPLVHHHHTDSGKVHGIGEDAGVAGVASVREPGERVVDGAFQH